MPGLSGTKDNHLLLPLNVAQRVPGGADELLATDAKMCEIILRNEEVILCPILFIFSTPVRNNYSQPFQFTTSFLSSYSSLCLTGL